MANFEIPYAIGAIVWAPGAGVQETQVVCPECEGTLVVTLELANGERYSLACGCCRIGFDPPRGWITERVFESDPRQVELREVCINGDRIEYRHSKGYCSADELFSSKEECEAKCQELQAQHQARENDIVFCNLKSKRRDLAWSVHYWRRKIKDLERDLAHARGYLVKAVTNKES